MKGHLTVAVIAVLCLSLFCSFPALEQAQAQGERPLLLLSRRLRCSIHGHRAPDKIEADGRRARTLWTAKQSTSLITAIWALTTFSRKWLCGSRKTCPNKRRIQEAGRRRVQ